MRWGMVIDLHKCTGCGACAVACKRENATPPGVFWSRVHIYETGRYPRVKLRALPTLCMQCEEAACEKACPTGATWTRFDGIVMVNQDQCIGCAYCEWACPYESRVLTRTEPLPYHPAHGYTPFENLGYIQHHKGLIEKCHFCAPRIDQGLQPACVSTCPSGARTFGDLDDRESEISRLLATRGGRRRLEELGTKPKVFYLSLDEQLTAAGQTAHEDQRTPEQRSSGPRGTAEEQTAGRSHARPPDAKDAGIVDTGRAGGGNR